MTNIRLVNLGKKYPLNEPMHGHSFAFTDFWALKDISFEVNGGETLGIIGRNGAGKTTLLNIVAGVLSPTQGDQEVKGKVLGLFNLGVGFQDELTGRENIFLNGAILGATKQELDKKLPAIIEFSELGDFINMPVGSYSQGMRLRLGFSIVANLDCDILVIDEVLAVGDALFQNKCFERLMDFRRSGRTLIITSQSMDLIERLCDRVLLLEHGKMIFEGNPAEAINRYRALLNKENFSVGNLNQREGLIEKTKRWAEDAAVWGNKLGSKEIEINAVEIINKFGFLCKEVKSGEPLKIKVGFTVKNNITEPHFGIAVFRTDGVYCFGPNTAFDGYTIPHLKKGKGWFALQYEKFYLAPGEYRVSVAIWDKNEVLAFDYHVGYYALKVVGSRQADNSLSNMPFNFSHSIFNSSTAVRPDLNQLADKWGKRIAEDSSIKLSARIFNAEEEEKGSFFTGDTVKLRIDLPNPPVKNKNLYLWLGLYRDDEVYCQSAVTKINGNSNYTVSFPRLLLLPGGYCFSMGIWDAGKRKFLLAQHGIYPFKMVFNRQDRGTIYLPHCWRFKLPI